MKNTIYVAAGMYLMYGQPETREFKLVCSSAKPKMPYLTRNPDGLKLTGHHANLYELDLNAGSVTLFKIRNGADPNPPKSVKLTEDQLAAVKLAIDNNNFHD